MNSFIEDEYIDLNFLQDCEKIEIIPGGVTKYQVKEWDTDQPFERCKCTIKYEGRKVLF